jgi:hypothetical protein
VVVILVAIALLLFFALSVLGGISDTLANINTNLLNANLDLLKKLGKLDKLDKLDDIAEELNWYKKGAFAEKVVDGLRRLDK